MGILVLLCLFGILTGCADQAKLAKEQLAEESNPDRQQIQIFAMDTIMDLKVYDKDGEKAKDALLTCEKEINRLDGVLSATRESSEVSKINQNAGKEPVVVGEDTKELLNFAKEMYRETEGAFDITIAPVVSEWGFTKEEKKVPAKEEIQKLLQKVDIEKLSLDGENAFLTEEGMSIDLGGIAKGYTSDLVTKILKEKGIAHGIVSLGGNISAIGTREDGGKWKVAVQNPLDENDYVGVLEVSDLSVVTSGGYQRYFEQDGVRYHHIIDPKNGYPANNGLLSVSIICPQGQKADVLSTALFVMGKEKALDYWRKRGGFEAVLVTEAKEVLVTSGLKESFTYHEREGFSFTVVQ